MSDLAVHLCFPGVCRDVRIKHTFILEDPFDDPAGLAELIPDASPITERPDTEVFSPTYLLGTFPHLAW